MADKRNQNDDNVSGRSDEDVRGVADNMEDVDEFVDTDDDEDLDDEEDEESSTF